MKFCREGGQGRFRLDVVGEGRCGEGCRTNGKDCNQRAAKHETPAKPKRKNQKQIEKITPNFEPRCQQERFHFAAGGFMMYRRGNSTTWTRSNRPAAAGI
jgi:hypothetical protein